MRLLSSPFCSYCGESADTDDHITPRCHGGVVTIPACRACNMAVGEKQFASLSQKIDYVHTLANRAGRGHPFGFQIMQRHILVAVARWNATDDIPIESNAKKSHICDVCETPIARNKHYRFNPFVCSDSCYLIRKKIRYAAIGWRGDSWQPIIIPAKISPPARLGQDTAKPRKLTTRDLW